MTTTLVTGGNRGIGYAIVKVLSARLVSPTLIIGCRDIESGEESIKQLRTEGISVDLDVVRIDIEDDDSIREAVTSIGQKYGKLDCQHSPSLQQRTILDAHSIRSSQQCSTSYPA